MIVQEGTVQGAWSLLLKDEKANREERCRKGESMSKSSKGKSMVVGKVWLCVTCVWKILSSVENLV